ncbi:Uracil-regulated protein [Hortaea werneckii]|nr:Uracil-regulated protein [Hortaea werneckii]
MSGSSDDSNALLQEILGTLKSLKQDHSQLSSAVDAINGRVNVLAGVKQSHEGIAHDASYPSPKVGASSPRVPPRSRDSVSSLDGKDPNGQAHTASSPARSSALTSKIILTSYPGQAGVDPLPMEWGAKDPEKRGPVVVSRAPSTIKRRNAIGAHGGSYSIYYALGVASHQVTTDHKPDFTNTEPAAKLGPFAAWGDPKKIVAMDPFGHLAPWLYKDHMQNEGLEIRPSIAVTKAHMRLPELEDSVRKGRLVPDGKICLNDSGELAVTKIAVEPVWYLPGVAERFGVDEGTLRRALFEYTGGSYPELITRGDVKLFLPPIGGLTVYCFGDPAKMSDPNVRLALRVHDECNGSDVFGSDICTCRPYLIFGIEEAVKEAQNGGSGVVIYFRKEGRALGEVTKYLVYNARKRGSDKASEYFKRTENIAGVKDMRFQALMPDILHWLGITKIDRMLSMSDMKHDAIVEQGIPIHERVPIPDEMIPEDSRVEIDAKIFAGYFSSGRVITAEELDQVHGRAWEDVDKVNGSEDDDFYRYTSGRWLWNEESRLQERYKKFNIPGLKSLAAKACGAHSCIGMVKLAEGGFNKNLRLTMDNGAVVIARIPTPVVGSISKVLASEVATMDFVGNVLDIPVPRVIAWDGETANAAGCEYILMEEVKGESLGATWPGMELDEKFKIVEEIVPVQKKLQSVTFSRFESLYYKSDAVGDSAKDRFVIGPLAEKSFWQPEQTDAGIDRGLCSSAQSYLRAISKRGRSRCPLEKAPADPHDDSGLLGSPQARLSLLQKFEAISAHLLPSQPSLNKFTLFHWDLRSPNLFVEDGQITSLIDWQDAWVAPLFMQERRPQLLEYDGEIILRLPEYFETMEDQAEKTKVQSQVEKSILSRYYHGVVREQNPALQELFDLPLARTRRETVLFASDIWEGNGISSTQAPNVPSTSAKKKSGPMKRRQVTGPNEPNSGIS